MTRRLGSACLAAIALAGALAVVVPQHAASVALLAAGTVVVVAAAFLLLLAGPLVSTEQPVTDLDVEPGPGAAALDPQGLRDARRDLAAPAARGSLPGPVQERLVRAGLLDELTPAGPAPLRDPAGAAARVHRLLDGRAPAAPHGGPR